MKRIALITYEQYPPPAFLAMKFAGVEIVAVDIYALAAIDLTGFDALFIGTGADQRVLVEQRARLARFLDAGKTIVFCGHVAYPFLDALVPFVPLENYRLDDLRVRPLVPHPVFDGIDPEHLTFRRGVAGFYGRGHNPPAPAALVLNVLGARATPVDWQLDYAGGGALLVHAGNDLWGFGAEDQSAAKLPRQLVHWVAAREQLTEQPS